MKKHFLLFLAGVAFSVGAVARNPITLKWQDFRNIGIPPSDQVGMITDFLTLTQIDFKQAQTDGFWDLRVISANSIPIHNLQRHSIAGPVSGGLPVYQYGEPQQTYLGNIPYSQSLRYQRDTFGIFGIGEDIPYQQVSLSSITGSASDMLYIPAQAPGYTAPVIDFPATLYSNWFSTVQFTTQYQLTIAAAQYTRKPFNRSTKRETTTNVIGWGKALLNDPFRAGQVSDSIDVLQMEMTEVTTDIYTDANGGAMDTTILSALALEDTTVDTVGYILLVRRGETTPLLRVRYDGTPESATLQDAQVHFGRLHPLGVSGAISTMANVQVYPNPVRRGEALSIDCAAAGDWQLRLSSITGQQVLDARWSRAQAGTEAVQMPPVSSGMYIYQLFKDEQPVKTGRLLLGE